MFKTRTPLIIAPALLAAAPTPGTLTIDVGNVRSARGVVHLDVCRQPQFLTNDCTYAGDAPAQPGITRVIVEGVMPGVYAIQASQDENRNHKVDRGLFGIPKEGVGFSRNARIVVGPPKWADAEFTVTGGEQHLEFNLRYFSGASGPPK